MIDKGLERYLMKLSKSMITRRSNEMSYECAEIKRLQEELEEARRQIFQQAYNIHVLHTPTTPTPVVVWWRRRLGQKIVCKSDGDMSGSFGYFVLNEQERLDYWGVKYELREWKPPVCPTCGQDIK